MIGCVDLVSDPTTDGSARLDLPTSEEAQPASLCFAVVSFVVLICSS
jgi:hypothetical protein